MLVHSTAVRPPLALQYGQFVTAAYDVYTADPNNLSPRQAQYPSFPDGYRLFLNIQMTDFFGSTTTPRYYGFVAESTTTPGAYVVALRGTQSWEEWWDDFHWELVQCPGMPSGAYVAEGFLALYQTFAFAVPGSPAPSTPLARTDPLSAFGGGPVSSLVLVGHSLGSALATLYSADLGLAGAVQPKLYTLASPRVGNTAFVAGFDAAVGTSYRVWNWPDLVPAFPKDPFDNYEHVKGGYEVDSLGYPTVVQISVTCFHSLLTYLFLLGAPASILGGWEGCGY
jgi:triacylglycerol lipase